jgi:hypothetical protein
MSIAVAFAALMLVPAQAPPPDPAGDPPPPVVELKPVDEAAPDAPKVPVLPPPAPKPDKPAPPAESQGIGAVGVGAIQVAVGTGACCAGCCISSPFWFGLALVPVVGGVASSVLVDLVVGTSIGVAETWAGDAWGKQRAALLWPVVASAGILLSSTALSTVARIVEPVTLPPFDPNNPPALNQVAVGGPVTTIANYYSLAACVGAVVLPAIAYAVVAEDKKPGDTGGFPGVMEPAHPAATTKPTRTAMRY